MTIENEEPPALTKYGRMRERYLREHKKVLYFNLLTSGNGKKTRCDGTTESGGYDEMGRIDE